MLSLPASIRIFVYAGATDMRRSFDRLAQMVEEHLEQDPESGHLYLFFNRRRNCVKMLLWEADGFVIWYKRLEEGTFVFPMPDEQRSTVGTHGLLIRPAELAMLLEGIDLSPIKRRKRYQRPTSAKSAPQG